MMNDAHEMKIEGGQTGFHPESLHPDRKPSSYRPDIDGLRAVAVVAVILFHAGFSTFSGGFVGVDVFFVISGFLITQILVRDLGDNRHSIGRFYERRVRRIIPALMLVTVFCVIVAQFVFIPADLQQFSKSVVATTGFVSNFYFWRQSGYFEADAHLKPLLHTWSLAVEEQFYIVYPLVLYLVLKFMRRALVPILLIAVGGSLLLSESLAHHHQYAAFFLAPGRVWELGVGCLLAVTPLPDIRNALIRNATAIIGLAAILFAVFAYNAETPFPGFHAAIPVLGAALLIYANQGEKTYVGKLLSTPPALGIGLISYSLYLWHWPLFAFAHSVAIHELDAVERIGIIALSVVLATLSWKYVENPFRTGRPLLPDRRWLFSAYALSSAAVLSVAGITIAAKGFPHRFSPQVLEMASYVDFNRGPYFRTGTCFLDGDEPLADYSAAQCFTAAKGETNVLLWGDSHAANYAYGLRQLEETRHFHLLQATVGGCLPIVGWKSWAIGLKPWQREKCEKFNHQVRALLERNKPQVVVLGGIWAHVPAVDRPGEYRALQDLIRFLNARGIFVYLMGPSIEYQDRLPVILARAIEHGLHTETYAAQFLDRSLFAVDKQMHSLFPDRSNFAYLSVMGAVCKDQICPVESGGVPLQWDRSHVTGVGSAYLARAVFPQRFGRWSEHAEPPTSQVPAGNLSP